jgi:hypothetical protein
MSFNTFLLWYCVCKWYLRYKFTHFKGIKQKETKNTHTIPAGRYRKQFLPFHVLSYCVIVSKEPVTMFPCNQTPFRKFSFVLCAHCETVRTYIQYDSSVNKGSALSSVHGSPITRWTTSKPSGNDHASTYLWAFILHWPEMARRNIAVRT